VGPERLGIRSKKVRPIVADAAPFFDRFTKVTDRTAISSPHWLGNVSGATSHECIAKRKALVMFVIEEIRPQAQAAMREARMFIDGEWVSSLSGGTLTVENPAKCKPIATIARGDASDVNRAVGAAARAFPAWSKVAPRDRGRLLLRIADRIESTTEELARLIALETGNALRTQARGEVRLAADIFRYFGGLAGELKGETIPLGEQVLSYTRREPLGVVGAIIPWNAPVLLGALKIAPALCAATPWFSKQPRTRHWVF